MRSLKPQGFFVFKIQTAATRKHRCFEIEIYKVSSRCHVYFTWKECAVERINEKSIIRNSSSWINPTQSIIEHRLTRPNTPKTNGMVEKSQWNH